MARVPCRGLACTAALFDALGFGTVAGISATGLGGGRVDLHQCRRHAKPEGHLGRHAFGQTARR